MTKCCSGSLSVPAPASPGLPLFDPSSSFISPSVLSSYVRHPRRSVQRFASISVKLSPSLSPARSVVLSLIISGLPRVKFYSASRRPRQSTRFPAARGPDNTQPALTGTVFGSPPLHPPHPHPRPHSQTTSRFLPHVAIETEAVLSLDEDTVLLTSEVRVRRTSNAHV